MFESSLTVKPSAVPLPEQDLPLAAPGSPPAQAVLAGGCFWCTEAVFRALDGVLEVISGYAGDGPESATYERVCSGRTNHAEVIRVVYDPARVRLGALLRVFFAVAHDPTQLDRQGNDRGRQYRSAIFYADEAQRQVAAAYIRQLDRAGVFNRPIVTRLEPLEDFFEAEPYHQDYAARNPQQPYIAHVALPKVDKLRAFFAGELRP
ncbi:MAG TPA: peptide-methionine (S)-S-oxide reductase MsrA [Nevskiaceae bacterium]|nr:peptide-methionine (S)-S-oxide reductase MsrA [Nevskiaceae bacterium]